MHFFNEMVEKYTIRSDRIIKKICAPLADYLSIPVFIYFRIEEDGHFGHISNYPANLDFFYAEQLFLDFPYFISPKLLRSGFDYTSVAFKPEDVKKISLHFHISQLFIILQHKGFTVEGFGFATKAVETHQGIDFLPKLTMLHTFITYFKRESETLIKNMMLDSPNLANAKGNSFYQADPSLPLLNADMGMQKFLKVTCPLSCREQQCLELFKQGKSAQATAAILHLSQRTVEHYLDHLKEKLGCKSKWELLDW